MNPLQLSTCFCTKEVDQCKNFYLKYFSASTVFDCGLYVTLRVGQGGPEISIISPQEGMTTFSGGGVMLNFKVEDADAEYARLNQIGLEISIPIADPPWGDRGFSVSDPIGNLVYIYSDRKPSQEFAQFYSN
ncbi:VOC family protein [Shewanella sp. 10N.261.52.F9]|uniref:VOC family protein n=1 Tax=Shewanella sp. 10N.261.52.F9 TaxID=3229684 RepID=UPI00354CB0DD